MEEEEGAFSPRISPPSSPPHSVRSDWGKISKYFYESRTVNEFSTTAASWRRADKDPKRRHLASWLAAYGAYFKNLLKSASGSRLE